MIPCRFGRSFLRMGRSCPSASKSSDNHLHPKMTEKCVTTDSPRLEPAWRQDVPTHGLASTGSSTSQSRSIQCSSSTWRGSHEPYQQQPPCCVSRLSGSPPSWDIVGDLVRSRKRHVAWTKPHLSENTEVRRYSPAQSTTRDGLRVLRLHYDGIVEALLSRM